MYRGIKRAVALVNRDPDLRALIITGTDDVFAPGGDLGGRRSRGTSRWAPTRGADILPFLAIRDSPAPVIAAVNGICQAGGLLIAMMADIAVVSDRADLPGARAAAGHHRRHVRGRAPGPRRHRGGAGPPAVRPAGSTRRRRSGSG